MGKEEETSSIMRRMTRSSSSASGSVSHNALEATKASDPKPSNLNGLLFGDDEKPISPDDMLSSFPGRRSQILELVRHLGPLNSPMLPLFMYGGTSTGKTSIIRQIFKHLKRPFVYSSCLTCYNPRILFESFLNQLLLHRKNATNGYLSAKRCERPSDFINFLREALLDKINDFRRNKVCFSSKKLETRYSGHMIYLIFDNLELVKEWEKSSTILPFLFNLYDVLKLPEIGVIFISNTSPDTYYSNMGFIEPVPVYFPDYTEDDLQQIFMRNQSNKKLYSSFLSVVLGYCSKATRRVDELSVVLSLLYKKYCEPLSDPRVVPNEEMKRILFRDIKPHIAPTLNEIFKVSSQPSIGVEATKQAKQNNSVRKSGWDAPEQLTFHMCTSAKYLLLSAFLASRNPPTLDASLFDSTGGSDNRKRKRKTSEKSKEQKETAELESLAKGPGTFPLERLIAIFQCITSVSEVSNDADEQRTDCLGVWGGDNSLMSDVLLQLSSLCNANFIVKGGSCPLEGSTRYRSTVTEDMAVKVAKSLNFPLKSYLYRR